MRVCVSSSVHDTFSPHQPAAVSSEQLTERENRARTREGGREKPNPLLLFIILYFCVECDQVQAQFSCISIYLVISPSQKG